MFVSCVLNASYWFLVREIVYSHQPGSISTDENINPHSLPRKIFCVAKIEVDSKKEYQTMLCRFLGHGYVTTACVKCKDNGYDN